MCSESLIAQRPGNILKGIGNRIPQGGGGGGMGGPGGASDTVISRNRFDDSVTVTIYYLDSSRGIRPDSSIDDYTKRFPIPATHIYLGNTGTATRSILFAPVLKSGFDPGFHAFDAYKLPLESVRFYTTTRPYTELGYMLASRAEQIIELFHTQNLKPYWNFSFNYRLINSHGALRNQKTNHNNYLITSWYQSPSKRYNNYLFFLSNQLQSGESGGLKNDQDYLNDPQYAKDRYLIPSKIGGDPQYDPDFFSNAMATGNRYGETNLMMRQQYDLGRKDSLVTDSTVIPLFFPRLRFEHSFKYGKYHYSFRDMLSNGENRQTNMPDSTYYRDYYDIDIPLNDSILFRDQWKEISNDFSIYQFPDAKNLHQYIKLGAELQLLNGKFHRDSAAISPQSFYNVIAHGEYRNRTKNQKWNMLAFTRLFLNGYNLGDYHAYISLQRLMGSKFGSFQIGFENINRKPPFIYDQKSPFYLDAPKTFNKENITHLFASIFFQKLRINLSADYYLISNYLYMNGYRQLQQESTLFNVLRVNAFKHFRISRHWNLHTEVYLQQKTGGAQLNMPIFYTRNRFMYQGNLGFKNLDIAMGVEARYHSPYKADHYSPLLGKFFYQDTVTINNRPDVQLFVHFRIRSFRAYVRAENLNTANFIGGFQFNNNNIAAPDYPTPGLVLRFGIYWSFVN